MQKTPRHPWPWLPTLAGALLLAGCTISVDQRGNLPDPDKLADGLQAAPSGPPRRAGRALSSVVGCRFAPRCRLATDRCRAESPPQVRINSQRAAACWRLDVAAPDLLQQDVKQREETIGT